MASIQQDLESFTQFARQRIQAEGPALSMDELYDQWRERHSAPEDAAAILASVRDMEKGETGRDFAAFAEGFSKQNQIPESS
jgi:anthranilate phosphoribosyltransferase